MATLDRNTISEFDIIIGLDASGSMGTGSKRFPGKTRWEELQEMAFGIATEVNKYDSDGIDVVVFGGNVEMHTGVTPEKVSSIFASRSPRGSTPLAEALQKVVTKQQTSGKNTVAIIFTDGEPDNQEAAAKIIVNASKNIHKDEALTFLFVQIGDDAGASRYLTFLDEGLPGAKFDIVDTVPAPVADKMDPIDLIIKAIGD